MTQRSRSLNLALVVSAILAISACDRRDDRSAGQQLDATVAKTEQAAERAKADIQREAADAKSALKQGASEAKADAATAAENAKAAVADAGAKTGAALERTADTVVEKVTDAGITAGVNAELAKDSTLSALRIDVDTQNGKVVLRGSAPSVAARERATLLARSVKGVNAVDNLLDVRG